MGEDGGTEGGREVDNRGWCAGGGDVVGPPGTTVCNQHNTPTPFVMPLSTPYDF